MEQAAKISPDRLVTFSYAHIPWIKKAQKILEVRGLPQASEKLAMFEAAYKILTKNGYNPIGLDHYAKPDDELNLRSKTARCTVIFRVTAPAKPPVRFMLSEPPESARWKALTPKMQKTPTNMWHKLKAVIFLLKKDIN
jgi:hypothetical protein